MSIDFAPINDQLNDIDKKIEVYSGKYKNVVLNVAIEGLSELIEKHYIEDYDTSISLLNSLHSTINLLLQKNNVSDDIRSNIANEVYKSMKEMRSANGYTN